MSWDLVSVAGALAEVLADELEGINVFDSPPETINPPAIVVSYPDGVMFGTTALGIDRATIPIALTAARSGDPAPLISSMIAEVRSAIGANPTLAGKVKRATATELRSIANSNVAGIDVMVAALIVEIDS